MVKRVNIKVGPEFFSLRNEFKKELTPYMGRRLSDTYLTDRLAFYLRENQIDKLLIDDAKRRYKKRNL